MRTPRQPPEKRINWHESPRFEDKPYNCCECNEPLSEHEIGEQIGSHKDSNLFCYSCYCVWERDNYTFSTKANP